MRWPRNLAALWFAISLAMPAPAETPTVEQARAALAIAGAQRERERAKALAARGMCFESHAEAALAAAQTNRPLIVWVGVRCEESPAVRSRLPDAIHCHLKEWNGDKTPRVVFPGLDGTSYSFEKQQLGEDAAQVIRMKTGLAKRSVDVE